MEIEKRECYWTGKEKISKEDKNDRLKAGKESKGEERKDRGQDGPTASIKSKVREKDRGGGRNEGERETEEA